MPEPRYHIIFSTLIEGRQPAQVYHDLADLFKIEQALVQQIFARQGAVVKSDLDRATAEQYVQIILVAGAICVIEPILPVSSTAAVATDPLLEAQEALAVVDPPPVVEAGAELLVSETDLGSRQLDDESRIEDAGRDALNFQAPVFAALMLLAGACLPIMSGSGQVYWPWRFAFEPQPPGLLWWVVLPVAAVGMLSLLRAPAFSLIVACVGAVTLLATSVVLWEAALILPLRILPFDRAAALVYVLPLLGTAVCSAACRAMCELGELMLLRLLAFCGSLAVLIPAGVALFSAGMIWARWPMILLLLLLLLYGVLVLVCACMPSVSEFILDQVRLLGMFLVCWAPIAVFLAHLPLSEPDTGRVLFMAVLKAGLLYYGACAAVTGGLRAELLYRFEKQAHT